MRESRSGLRLFVLACALVFSMSIQTAAQQVFKSCEKDIKTYCSKVEPGDGRLLACLYAHENKISDSCDGAIGDAADQLDWFMDKIRIALATCAPDIQKHCAKVALGGGRVYRCLKGQQANLNKDCSAIVDDVTSKLAN